MIVTIEIERLYELWKEHCRVFSKARDQGDAARAKVRNQAAQTKNEEIATLQRLLKNHPALDYADELLALAKRMQRDVCDIHMTERDEANALIKKIEEEKK